MRRFDRTRLRGTRVAYLTNSLEYVIPISNESRNVLLMSGYPASNWIRACWGLLVVDAGPSWFAGTIAMLLGLNLIIAPGILSAGPNLFSSPAGLVILFQIQLGFVAGTYIRTPHNLLLLMWVVLRQIDITVSTFHSSKPQLKGCLIPIGFMGAFIAMMVVVELGLSPFVLGPRGGMFFFLSILGLAVAAGAASAEYAKRHASEILDELEEAISLVLADDAERMMERDSGSKKPGAWLRTLFRSGGAVE